MTDIFYEIELGRIKKRFGNLVSINAELTAEFAFVPDEIESLTRIFAVWDRTDLTEEEAEQYPLMSEIDDNVTVIPSALFSRPGAYSLTVIGWNEEGDEPAVITDYDSIPDTSSFRSTEAFRGYILESGFQSSPYAASYGDGIFESIKEATTDKVYTDFLNAVNAQLDPDIGSTNNLPAVIAGKISGLKTEIQGLNHYIELFVSFVKSFYDFAHDDLNYTGTAYTDENPTDAAFNAIKSYLENSASDYVDDLKAASEELRSAIEDFVEGNLDYSGTTTKEALLAFLGAGAVTYINSLKEDRTRKNELQGLEDTVYTFLDELFNFPFQKNTSSIIAYLTENDSDEEPEPGHRYDGYGYKYVESIQNALAAMIIMLSYFDIDATDDSVLKEAENVYNYVLPQSDDYFLADYLELFDSIYSLLTTYLQYTTNPNWKAPGKMLEYIVDDDDSTGNGIKILQGYINAAARAINFVNTSMGGDFDLTESLESTLQQFYDYLSSDGDYDGAGAAEFLDSFRSKLAAALNESSTTKTYDDLIDDVETINGQSQTILNSLYSFYTGGNA